VADMVLTRIRGSGGKYVITVAGESGAGKSEIAQALADRLEEDGIKSAILQQDDYFIYPPRTNDQKRRDDPGHLGPEKEVRLDVMDENLSDILEGRKEIKKPLVIYQEDRITSETINVEDVRVAIAEGTYTTLLNNVNTRVFIDRIYTDTKAARLERAREEQNDFLERVLKIEHQIISRHRSRADIIVTRDFKAVARNGW
jgi:uridine kinase